MTMPNDAPLYRTLIRLMAAGILTLACAGAWAQNWQASATPVFRHASLGAAVLPTTMIQDREGQIWIGTQTGLFRWDGYQAQRVAFPTASRASLRLPLVAALHEDREGRLWIGTGGGDLARFDPRTGGLIELPIRPPGQAPLRVRAIAADGGSGLWVGTDRGLKRVDLATRGVHGIGDEGMPRELPAGNVNAILVDARGDLWVGMSEGLFVLQAGAPSFRRMALADGKAAEEVRVLAQDAGGRLWIGTRTTGVFIRDPATGGIRRLMDSEHPGQPLVDMDLQAITDAGNGEMWLATWGVGILRVDTASWTTKRLRHDPNIPASLAADVVSILFRDRSGMVWAGGVGVLDATAPAQRAITNWFGSDGRLSAGATAQASSILARPDGSVWVGDDIEGIDIIPPDRGAVRHIPARDGGPSALPRSSVLSLANAFDGRVFVGTVKGLYVAAPDGSRVERLELPGMAPKTNAAALCVSGKRLWIGTEQGLRYLDPSSQPTSGAIAGLEGVSVYAINCDSDRQLWIGTPTGLMRYRPDTGVVDRPWREGGAADASLPEAYVTTIARDAQNRLWVAFFGAGVCVVPPENDGKAGAVRCLDGEHGMSDLAANALAIDAQGNAWVSTDNGGIVRIDGQTLRPVMLQRADGVGLDAFWTTSVATTPEGDILFGGNGLTIVHPAQYQPWRYPAAVVLTDLDGRMTKATDIRLDASTRSVQMNFALLDYSGPERVRYSYRLAPLEETWTESPVESRMARYTNLRPGDYAFEVRVRNRVGEWSTTRFPVHVEPAWYETAPARLAAVGLLLLLLWAAVRLRLRMLAQRAAQLSEQVAQRTMELQQRTEQLEVSRQALRRLGAHTAHTLEEERKRVARELHDELGQQLVAMRMEVSVMKAHAEAGRPPTAEQWQLIRDRVDRFTASMRALVADLRPPALDGGLEPALQWLAAEYRRVSGANCEVQVDPEVRSLRPAIKTMLFRVAQESLNNVARHANASNVRLQLRRREEGWDLDIEDDGVGFDTESPPSGFGLLSMEERAQLGGGNLSVASRLGKGSNVHLHLPDTAGDEAPSS
jgi:ligand-binding sensor domain-containing protein/signal transduction histidine kinase